MIFSFCVATSGGINAALPGSLGRKKPVNLNVLRIVVASGKIVLGVTVGKNEVLNTLDVLR